MKKLYLASPHMSEEGYEQEYINDAFAKNWIAPLGENVDEFEKTVAEYVGVKHAAALSSGTAALHMALRTVGVQPGDVVLCQSLTFAASANPIVYEGAIPVFIDSDYETWNMDPKALKEALEKYPNAKAIIVVNLYGFTPKLDEIVDLCKEYGVPLIEDAAESLGATYKGDQTGSFGDLGVFSFNGNKIITTSNGGMLVSNNKEEVDKVRFWATQARDLARHYQHSELGFNYRMSNVLAGIGRGQMKVLDRRVQKKKYIFEFYQKELGYLDSIQFMPKLDECEPNYWLTTFISDKNPVRILEELEKHNIDGRPLWKPMHMQPYYSHCDFVGEHISDDLFERGICLPSDSKMNDEDLMRVCKVIKECWDNV